MATMKETALAVALMSTIGAGAADAGECKRLAAAGDGLTRSIAEFMARKGLENVIKGYGMSAQGAVKVTCEEGTIYTECHASQTACK